MTYAKLSDIRAALESSLGRPVSRQLSDEYTKRRDFPPPVITSPIRLWRVDNITEWLTHLSPR